MVTNRTIITKVYLPRLIIPVASVISGLVDFAIAFIVLIAMTLYYGILPTYTILFVPLFILFAMAASLGISLWLTALHINYRDVQYLVPFLMQFWLFATPIAYPSSLVPARWRAIYGLNPMAGVVEGFRWALLGIRGQGLSPMFAVSVILVIFVIVSGLLYFRRTERTFADVI
jgi:lipopolysaccharide transport system permease protein